MKKSLSIISIVIFLLIVFLPMGLHCKGFVYQVDFFSRYIWRGWDLNPVHKPVLQPSVTYVFGDSGFSVNLWNSFSFEDKNAIETNLAVSYDFKTSENFSLSAGFIHYGDYFAENFSFKNDTSHEIYITAGLPTVFLTPEVSIFYDFHNGDGLYASLWVGHSLKLDEKITADLSASLGYNAGQWLPKDVDTGFSDLNFELAVPFKAGKFTITPSASYTIVLLDFIKADTGDDNHFWFGISVTL